MDMRLRGHRRRVHAISMVIASVVIASEVASVESFAVLVASFESFAVLVASFESFGPGSPARVCYVRVGVGSIVPPPTLRQRASA